MKLIILGGDVRLRYTADRLSRKHEVYTYGQSDRDMLPDGKCDAAVQKELSSILALGEPETTPAEKPAAPAAKKARTTKKK